MKKKVFPVLIICVILTIAVASLICILIFDTKFAKSTVDYFSFFAGLVLIIDGFYKIGHYKEEPYFPNHFIRHFRIIIGVCVFTIHFMQYVYGV